MTKVRVDKVAPSNKVNLKIYPLIKVNSSSHFYLLNTEFSKSVPRFWSPKPPPPPPPLKFSAFLTPKMDSLTPKTWEKSPNNIEIGPNFTYPVSRGLETGLAVLKVPHLLKLRSSYFFKHFLNTQFVPQVLKQVVKLSCKLALRWSMLKLGIFEI